MQNLAKRNTVTLLEDNGLGEKNERGTRLINFCEENKLVIMKTFSNNTLDDFTLRKVLEMAIGIR